MTVNFAYSISNSTSCTGTWSPFSIRLSCSSKLSSSSSSSSLSYLNLMLAAVNKFTVCNYCHFTLTGLQSNTLLHPPPPKNEEYKLWSSTLCSCFQAPITSSTINRPSATHSQPPSVYVPSLIWQTKYKTHIKQQEKLYFCVFLSLSS